MPGLLCKLYAPPCICCAVQGVLEGLQAADAPERDVPPGSMRVTLHPYQRRALGCGLCPLSLHAET